MSNLCPLFQPNTVAKSEDKRWTNSRLNIFQICHLVTLLLDKKGTKPRLVLIDKFWTILRQIIKWLTALHQPVAQSRMTWIRTKCGQMFDLTNDSWTKVRQMSDKNWTNKRLFGVKVLTNLGLMDAPPGHYPPTANLPFDHCPPLNSGKNDLAFYIQPEVWLINGRVIKFGLIGG